MCLVYRCKYFGCIVMITSFIYLSTYICNVMYCILLTYVTLLFVGCCYGITTMRIASPYSVTTMRIVSSTALTTALLAPTTLLSLPLRH